MPTYTSYLYCSGSVSPGGNVASGNLGNIDEGIEGGTPDGAFLNMAANGWGSTTTTFGTLANLPIGAESINSIVLRVRAGVGGDATPDDTNTFAFQFNGTGAPATTVNWTDADCGATATQVNREFTISSGLPTVAQFNAWTVQCVQTFSQSMGPDGQQLVIDGIEVEVSWDGTNACSGTPSIPAAVARGIATRHPYLLFAMDVNINGTTWEFEEAAINGGVQSGDVIVVFLTASSNITWVDNNGGNSFTEEVESNYNGTNASYAIYSRVAGASEPSTYQFTSSVDVDPEGAGVLAVFRGTNTSDLWDVSPSSVTPGESTASNTVSSNAMTTTDEATVGLIFSGRTWTLPGSMSLSSINQGYTAEYDDLQQANGFTFATNVYSTSGTKAAVTVTTSGTVTADEQIAIQVALRLPSAGATRTASGTPSIDQVTASGSVTQTYMPSGAPSVDQLTAAGSVTQIYRPSGGPSIDTLTASGVATLISALEASGTPAIESPVAAGVADIIKRASGTPAIDTITASGVASMNPVATGAPAIDALTASGSVVLAPRVWLNTSQTLTGATEMTVASYNLAGTSITFTDPIGAPTGAVFLGVENRTAGGGEDNTGWIAATVQVTASASGTPVMEAVTAAGVVDIIKRATGTPSIDTITASGSVFQILMPSGTPSIETITASGFASTAKVATGTPSIDTITASGSVFQTYRPSGTPSIEVITANGVVTIIKRASGTPSIDVITAAGNVNQILMPSGSPSIETITASGVASLAGALEATGTPSIETITASGEVDIVKRASGSPSIDTVTSAGQVTQTLRPSGSPSINEITASGVATAAKLSTGSPSIETITASGVVNLAPRVWLNQTQTLTGAVEMTVTAYSDTSITFTDPPGEPIGAANLGVENRNAGGGEVNTGWISVTVLSGAAYGNPVIEVITASGVAEISGLRTASGTPSIDVITASGVASANQPIATGTPTIDAVTSSGVVNNIGGTLGMPTLATITASGVARIAKVATGSPSIDTIFSAGSVTQVYMPSGSPSIEVITANGIATLNGSITAIGSPSIDEIAASGQVNQIYRPSGSPSLDTVTATGQVTQTYRPSGSPQIETITASGLARFAHDSSGSPSIDVITASGVATVDVGRTASGTPAIETITASGQVVQTYVVSGSPSIDTITAAGTVVQVKRATGSPSIETIVANGLVSGDRIATGSPAIDEITASGTVVLRRLLTATGTPSIEEVQAAGFVGDTGAPEFSASRHIAPMWD